MKDMESLKVLLLSYTCLYKYKSLKNNWLPKLSKDRQKAYFMKWQSASQISQKQLVQVVISNE